MQRLGFAMHVLVLSALLVNLWLGGDLVEAWAGHLVRAVFELVLILGYVVLVLGWAGPIGRDPGRRR